MKITFAQPDVVGKIDGDAFAAAHQLYQYGEQVSINQPFLPDGRVNNRIVEPRIGSENAKNVCHALGGIFVAACPDLPPLGRMSRLAFANNPVPPRFSQIPGGENPIGSWHWHNKALIFIVANALTTQFAYGDYNTPLTNIDGDRKQSTPKR